MYVILKGMISVKISKPDKKDVRLHVAMPSDGDAFGELSAIDFKRINVNANTKSRDFQTVDSHDPETLRRGGTCACVEDTIMLRVDHNTAREILQPMRKLSTASDDKLEAIAPVASFNTEAEKMLVNNEIGRKIELLKSSFGFFAVSAYYHDINA